MIAEEIIRRLVEQTQCGNMLWREADWEEGDSGAPTYWLTEWHDCQFGAGVFDQPAQLLMYSPQTLGSTVIAEGESVDELTEILRVRFGGRRTTKDEMLAFALDRLMNHPQDFQSTHL